MVLRGSFLFNLYYSVYLFVMLWISDIRIYILYVAYTYFGCYPASSLYLVTACNLKIFHLFILFLISFHFSLLQAALGFFSLLRLRTLLLLYTLSKFPLTVFHFSCQFLFLITCIFSPSYFSFFLFLCALLLPSYQEFFSFTYVPFFKLLSTSSIFFSLTE